MKPLTALLPQAALTGNQQTHFPEAKGHEECDPRVGQCWSTGSHPVRITNAQTAVTQQPARFVEAAFDQLIHWM